MTGEVEVLTPDLVIDEGRDMVYRVGRVPRGFAANEFQFNSEFRSTVERNPGEWAGFMREVFGRLLRVLTTRMDEPAVGASWAERLHDAVSDLPEWERAWRTVDGNPHLAAVAASRFGDAVAELLGDEGQQNMPDASTQDIAEEAQRQEDAGNQASADVLWSRAAAGVSKMFRLDDVVKDTDPVVMRRVLRDALNKASGAVREALVFADALGSEASAQERTEVMRAAANNPELRAIMKLAGRMRTTIRGAKKARVEGDGREKTVGITYGRSLEQAVGMERALFRHPRLGLVQKAKFVEGRLLMNKQVGFEVKMKAGEGPLVFLLDESGSMKRRVGGHRLIDMGRAALFNMAMECSDKGRPFAVVHFATNTEARFFPNGVPVAELLAELEVFLNGGTKFTAAFDHAQEVLRRSEMKQGDVVIISDAKASEMVSSSRFPDSPPADDCFLKAVDGVRRAGARIWGVLLGESSAIQVFSKFCDSVIHIPNAAEDSAGKLALHLDKVLIGDGK